MRKYLVGLLLMGALVMLPTAPAFADHRHHDGCGHSGYGYRSSGYRHSGYYRPVQRVYRQPVYVARPYYAPAPVYGYPGNYHDHYYGGRSYRCHYNGGNHYYGPRTGFHFGVSIW